MNEEPMRPVTKHQRELTLEEMVAELKIQAQLAHNAFKERATHREIFVSRIAHAKVLAEEILRWELL